MSSSATQTPHMKPSGTALKWTLSLCAGCCVPTGKVSVWNGKAGRPYSVSRSRRIVALAATLRTFGSLRQASWLRRSRLPARHCGELLLPTAHSAT